MIPSHCAQMISYCLGHGAANVTLGIPRLREIIMTASSKPKTPSMTMKVKDGVPKEDIEAFCKRASRLTLSQVVKDISISEQFTLKGETRQTKYTIRINFFPESEYQSAYEVLPDDILLCFAASFPLSLKKEITAELKKLDALTKGLLSDLGKASKPLEPRTDGDPEEEESEGAGRKQKSRDDDEDSDGDDDDADHMKRARQRKEQATYEADESEEEDASQAEALDEDDESSSRPVTPDVLSEELESALKAVSASFKYILHICTSFTFDPSSCTIKLEASSPYFLIGSP
jgi:hypothetical protein